MQFFRAVDAYRWYRSTRYAADHPEAMPRSFYHAAPMQRAVEALHDIGTILDRMDAAHRRALRDNTAGVPEACAALEDGLRRGGYLVQ
ncbi:hypothetical protein ASZ90_000481 [hydrocarbon metagenome]|uniref:Uncharacterized protein n=1 Tax=hydrocarbon metagenome TaxID=938273 RepID=A0A0W8G944_9ZZZZ